MKEKKHKHEDKRKGPKIVKIIGIAIILLLTIFLIYSINRLNIIPAKFMIAGILVLAIINIISALLLLSKKKVLNVISIILYLILIAGCCYGIHFSNVTDNFLDKAFDNEIKSFSLKYYVLSQNEYTEKDINNKDIYYFNNSEYINDAITKLNSKYVVNVVTIDDIAELFNQDLFLIDETTFELLTDELNIDKSKYHLIYEIDLSYTVENKVETEKEIKKNKHYYNIYVAAYDFHGNQTDLNKIVTVNTETNEVLITNIHRFAYLYVPAYGQKNRLNTTSVFGITNNIEALEYALNIKFDYYIVAKPDGLVTLVDDIGGIEYCSDMAFTTDHSQVIGTYDDSKGEKVHIKKGCQHLNGIETLTVARERIAFKMGAIERDNVTTAIMLDILEQIKKPANIANYTKILNDLSGMYNTSIPRDVITKTAKNMLDKGWKIKTNTIDGSNGTDKIYFSNHKASVYYLSPNSIADAVKKIKALDK